jgi:pyruvate dehydrogenase E2 component (dihydrolipoamide acetyltransferase)
MANGIEPIVMPKWGLAMTEGMVSAWSAEEGSTISAGDEICEIETSKLANMFESPVSGLLRKRVAAEDELLPVGALIAVVADSAVNDETIEEFIAQFQESFVPEEDEASAQEPESVIVNGKKLVYLKMGDDEGVPVLLLHGFGADMNGWLFNQGDLAEQATVYALDLPGHGQSAKDVDDGSIASMASTVVAFMQEISIQSAHVVGHSMGAAIALKIAADSAQLVSSLTLIAPAGLGEEINTDFLEGYMAARRQKHLKPVLEQLVNDKSLISGDMMEDVLKFKRIDGVTEGLKKIVENNFSGGRQAISMRESLAGLSMPVSVVWGRNDEIIPARHADALPDHVRVTIIEDSGHVPQMENAARINEIVQTTLKTAT